VSDDNSGIGPDGRFDQAQNWSPGEDQTAAGHVPPPQPVQPAQPMPPAQPAQSAQPAQMWGDATQNLAQQPGSGYTQPQDFTQQSPASGYTPPPQVPGSGGPWSGWEQQGQPGPQPSFPPLPTADAEPGSRGPGRRIAVATGIGVVGIIGLATVLLLNQTGASGAAKVNNAAATPKPSGFQPTATTPAGDAKQTAAAFLADWQSGNFSAAAQYTDDPTDAQTVLSAYRTGLNLSGLQLTEQNATAAGVVSFSVSASVSSTGTIAAGASTAASASTSAAATTGTASSTASGSATSATGTWAYTSQLTAYKKNGGWYVKWDPTMVAPNVSTTVHPVALAVEPGAGKVTDASGNDLSASSQAALQNIATLMKKNTTTGQGTAGLEIALEDSSGKIVSGSAKVLTNAVSTGVVKTTIDPSLETVATAAVAELPRSSMVVLRPSTGAILAIANSTGTSDVALTGTLAPGSSMKVITTTGLLADGLLSNGINTAVGCPLVETVQGVKIHNSTDSANSASGTEDFEPNNTPFSTDFSMSCNNAFTQWWTQMAGGKLAGAASTYYGLNEPWDIGLGSKGTYFSMPTDQSGSELAEELYGQGLVEANPLSMASVAATVDTGSFHQPYLVDGLTDKTTATALPSTVKSQLYTVMREVITSGTAAAVGFGSGVYGKTGTAEADANKDKNPNGWMIVFDPSKDLAIAAVVVDSNFGAKTAGPEVNYVLQHS